MQQCAQSKSLYPTASYLTFSVYLHLFCLPYSKCLTVKPGNPEVLGLLADVLGEALDESLCPYVPFR